MNRPIRIGLIAEGPTELGFSVPNIKPEKGGKKIDRDQEGALHKLIRRELKAAELPDCDFVHRHPTTKNRNPITGDSTEITGHTILTKIEHLINIVIAWKPEEIDVIIIVADADNELPHRKQDITKALIAIRDNHLDANEEPISDRSAGGLAIKEFETWLLADIETVSRILEQEIEPIENWEAENTKNILENVIVFSPYLLEERNINKRRLRIKWSLADHINLEIIKNRCANGYHPFIKDLIAAAKAATYLP
jgi:hypothetical protein